MVDNKTLILAEFERDKGEFVIMNWHVMKLIGVGEDDMDYYWLMWDGRKLSWCTCVGGYTKLKGKIDEKEYSKIVRAAKWNFHESPELFGGGVTEEKIEFSNKVKAEVENSLKGDDKFLTKLCWDFN